MGVVYLITNQINGKMYVGKTTRPLWDRWCQHKSRARHGIRNHFLYNAIRKHGIENFEIKTLQDSIPEERLDEREKDWIDLLQTSNPHVGYNCTPGGEGAKHGPSSKCVKKGWRTLSPETRKKLSIAHAGRKMHPDDVEKMRAALTGKKQSKKTIENRSASLKLAFSKPETKAKLSAIAKQRCVDGNRFWEKQDADARRRAAEKRKLWRQSPEGIAFLKRVSERHKGKSNLESLKKGWETRRARAAERAKMEALNYGEK